MISARTTCTSSSARPSRWRSNLSTSRATSRARARSSGPHDTGRSRPTAPSPKRIPASGPPHLVVLAPPKLLRLRRHPLRPARRRVRSTSREIGDDRCRVNEDGAAVGDDRRREAPLHRLRGRVPQVVAEIVGGELLVRADGNRRRVRAPPPRRVRLGEHEPGVTGQQVHHRRQQRVHLAAAPVVGSHDVDAVAGQPEPVGRERGGRGDVARGPQLRHRTLSHGRRRRDGTVRHAGAARARQGFPAESHGPRRQLPRDAHVRPLGGEASRGSPELIGGRAADRRPQRVGPPDEPRDVLGTDGRHDDLQVLLADFVVRATDHGGGARGSNIGPNR
ncbi:hypothetical protein SAMN05421684_5909 [Asanoa ishikariensis]|uniref:Uncharacterized protein n=1 Tax=Asanoa ishikariensis TaxID=137265 RepID=A0A1H3TJU4_9ACTN|nr:hypothetical protein SAMN05421684_5909 [Asanoa ishikariensis]